VGWCSDFGLCIHKRAGEQDIAADPLPSEQESVVIGTWRYAAPELVTLRCPTSSARPTSGHDDRAAAGPTSGREVDVFAFGLLLWETAHRQVVFAEREGLQACLALARGERPMFVLPPALADWEALICSCWAGDLHARPSMDECAETLLALWEAREALELEGGDCAPATDTDTAMDVSGTRGGPASAPRTAPGRGEQLWRHEVARLFTKEMATSLEQTV